MTIVGHFIGGQHCADAERTQDVFNPATGVAEKQVALASQSTVEAAIAAAEAAFPAWRNTTPHKRARVMFRFKELLEQHADEVVALITSVHQQKVVGSFFADVICEMDSKIFVTGE